MHIPDWRLFAGTTSMAGFRAVALVAALLVGACAPVRQIPVSAGLATSAALAAETAGELEYELGYMCPMHPDITSGTAGTCPICRMDLMVGRLFDMRNYGFELRTVPALVKAGEKATLELIVRHPDTDEIVNAFVEVHQRRYHMFVISQDMEYFEHIHPEQHDDGTWSVDVTLPKPGYYKVLSDFVPFGGSPQFIARPLVTAGYAGDLAADSAHLTPDTSRTQVMGDLTATIQYDPPSLSPAEHSHLSVHLARSGAGEPVKSLQTYLGAFGHVLIVSEDLVNFVHSHPLEMLPPDADFESLVGGPDVIFEALMPEPGRYRAWAQFRYRETIRTFPFTFEVRARGTR